MNRLVDGIPTVSAPDVGAARSPMGPRRRPTRTSYRMVLAIAASGVLAVSGCAGASTAGGDTTCSQWLALDLPVEEAFDRIEQGESNLSDEQQEILQDALDAEGLATDDTNVAYASYDVIQFCAPDGTGTRPNADQPIAGALR